MSKAYLDPGRAKPSAIAIFESGVLSALLTQVGADVRIVSGTWHTPVTDLLWEKPQVYPHSKCDPNQIVEDALNGAQAAAVWGVHTRSIAPRAWKGTIKKPPHHVQLWIILTAEEKALFPAGTEQYIFEAAKTLALTGKERGYKKEVVDLLDAAALGAYDLGRLAGPIAGRVTRPKRRRHFGTSKNRKH